MSSDELSAAELIALAEEDEHWADWLERTSWVNFMVGSEYNQRAITMWRESAAESRRLAASLIANAASPRHEGDET